MLLVIILKLISENADKKFLVLSPSVYISKQIETHANENNILLNNVEFQTIIKQISSKQYENFEIDKISSKLNINGQNNEEKLQNIINHCLKNPLDFARYKDVILKLRTSLGMLELV